jgi:hypothetical protein
VGPVRAVQQALRPLGLVALEPLVSLLAANVVTPAKLGVGEEAALGLDDETLPFGHGIGLQPWHRQLRKTRNRAARYGETVTHQG